MWINLLGSLVSTFSLCQAPAQLLDEPYVVGVARDIKENNVSYCEWHTPIKDNKKTIYYADAEGVLIAVSELDYESGPSTPTLEQRDLRSGEQRFVQRKENGWQIGYRKDTNAEVELADASLREVQVIGPGFVDAISANWEALQAGQTISFGFASTVFQKVIELRVKLHSRNGCSAGRNTSFVCVKVEPANALVRLFADKLYLEFDQAKKLRTFQGPVNLQDAAQKKQTMTIQYYYQEQ